jgi:hypothetical protein
MDVIAERNRTTSSGWSTPRRLLLAVLLIGAIWRITRYMLAYPLWGDEAFLAINFLTRDLRGLARPLEFGQVAPPGFLWAEWGVVQELGASERALRLIPFLAGLASLALFWRFCKGVATRRVALIAVAIFAASIYPVRHSNEVKPYTVDLFTSLSLISVGWALWRNNASIRGWTALFILGPVSVWFSYTAVFLVATVAILLFAQGLRQHSRSATLKTIAFTSLSFVSWLAMMLWFARGQLGETAWLTDLVTWRDAFPPLGRPAHIPWWLLKVHTGNMLAYPFGGPNFASTPTFLLVVVGAAGLWFRRCRRPLLWLLLGPLSVAFVAAALKRYPYGTSARVMLYMAPAFCLLAAEGIAALLRAIRSTRRGSVAVTVALMLICVGGLIYDLRGPSLGRDEIEIAYLVRDLARQAQPGDEWIVFDGATPLPGIPELMTTVWVQRVAIFRFYVRSLVPVPTRWEPDLSALAPAARGRTWFVVHNNGSKEYFPNDRRLAYERAVREHLGNGRLRLYGVARRSVIGVEVFEPRIAVSGQNNASKRSR